MPSTATITSFYNFSANTKARASQVNNNFDVFRGHIIPVDPSTATSADNTYDLGSSSYRWANVYAKSVISSSVSCTNLSATNISASTISASYFYGLLSYQTGFTTSAAAGYVASVTITASLLPTSGVTPISGSTISIATIGKPVILLINSGDTAGSTVPAIVLNEAPGTSKYCNIQIFRNGNFIYSTISLARTGTFVQPIENIMYIDIPPSGTNIYEIKYVADNDLYFTRARFVALEL